MRKLAICFLIGLGLQAGVAQAQLKDRLVPHMGFMYELVRFGDQLGSGQAFTRAYYTFHLGTYGVLAHANDIASVGIDGSVHFGISFPYTQNRGTVVTFVTQVPVFLMGRLGANSTPYNEQGIGIGVGIGGNYTYLTDVADYITGSTVRTGFFNPAAVAEVTILSRGGTLTGRVHMSLGKVGSVLSGDGRPDITYNMSNWGLGLIYGF